MNILDGTTLSLVNGLLVVVCGIAFLLETVIKRSDYAGRLWSMFFVALMLALFGYIVGSLEPQAWWGFPAGNGGFLLALGLLWSGARQANRRRPIWLLVFLAGAAVVIAGLLHGPAAGYWSGAFELFLGAAVFTGLAAFEFSRGALGRLPSARMLSVVLVFMAVYYATRAVAFLVLGYQHPAFDAIYGATTSTLIEIGLTVVGAITLSSIQADRFRSSSADADFGTDVTIDGVLAKDPFRTMAESWLARSIRERTALVLMIVEIADLSEVNIAFGRAAGDSAIRLTGRLILAHTPTATLVGQITPRRFALLMEASPRYAPETIADRIGDAVLSTPVDSDDRFRVSTFRGIAFTHASGARYDDLLRTAAEAVAVDKAAARAIARE